MEDNKTTMEQATELLEQRMKQERKALATFVEIYNQCQNKNERKTIFDMLVKAYYTPNKEELQSNYVRNLEVLKQYPYFWGKSFYEYEELPFQLFPASKEYFYCYNKEKDCFLGEYDATTDNQMRYFFENVDEPLKVENEDNFYNLNFLNDNVRASEDYAGDNHIYLFYDTPEPLERLMMTCDLGFVLKQRKFVFLVGEENKKRYPLDFQKEFGIDYTACQPKELSVNDIKRIIFGWRLIGCSGTSFLADVMDFHPDLLTIPDCAVYTYMNLYTKQLQGKTLSEAVSFLKKLPDKDPRKISIMRLVSTEYGYFHPHLPESTVKKFNRVSAEEFLTVLESVLAEFPCPSAREWLIGFYLAYSRCHGRSFGRLIPALFFYPHDEMFETREIRWDIPRFYFDLVGSFPYHKVIALIRNPISQAGSMVSLWLQKPSVRNAQGEIDRVIFCDMVYMCLRPKDFYFSLKHPLRESIRVVRFEDLKLNPKATFASMGEFLNIPVTQSMFHTTWCGLTANGLSSETKVFEGFDPAPVYKSYDQYLGVFDKYRIELLLQNRLEIYGYRAKYYDGQQFSDEEIFKMMEIPFLFESIKTAVPPERNSLYRDKGLQFIKYAAEIKKFPFPPDAADGDTEQSAPLPWLRPKEELLEQPLYH